jgi:hypothetical protein
VLAEEVRPPSSLAAAVTAAFRAFAGEMIQAGETDKARILAFSAQDAAGTFESADNFAAYIYKTMDENKKTDPSKWHKFGKQPLFGKQ